MISSFKIFTIVIIGFFWAINCNAKNNYNSKIHIKSEFITILKDKNKIIFNKNAVATKQDSTIISNKIIAYYDDKISKIKNFNAIGNVRIFNGEFTVTGDRGVYNINKNTFVLHDNVIFNNGISVANGKKFT